VVLRQTKSPSGNKGEAPFTYADADKTVGIVVLGHISSPAAKFFHVGERIRFASENASYEFVCLGVYAAPDEAAVLHPGLRDSAAWHILSPGQTMLLGKKHWLKG
ncbi:MAG TPA: hypothetical protein PLP17_04415, partial [Oligoflexia bacterium]|nr:hypothetical protein [Oligoflexia bacterium]